MGTRATAKIRSKRWLGLWLLTGSCALVAGCGSREKAAFTSFTETYSCPRDRTTVTPITGVTMGALWLRANPLPEPPADVLADQERLAVWQQAREKDRAGPLRGMKSYRLFHVSGCGQQVDYACQCPPQIKGSTVGRGSRQDFCSCQAPPAPITR